MVPPATGAPFATVRLPFRAAFLPNPTLSVLTNSLRYFGFRALAHFFFCALVFGFLQYFGSFALTFTFLSAPAAIFVLTVPLSGPRSFGAVPPPNPVEPPPFKSIAPAPPPPLLGSAVQHPGWSDGRTGMIAGCPDRNLSLDDSLPAWSCATACSW